ncbi:uncharacterized protein LOC126771193 [Nymphalis io]|uniref:uncharacterized protein LOC126771193 n=1 Tax=Inachis io TaxID=171585 RepID=UPI002168B20F|nr:uncharacterized protein LOC126771193 [Nymphalis io]
MYFYRYKELTYYIDTNSDNQEVIKTINSINVISVILRTTKTKLSVPNESYLITAGNTYDFNETFANLVREPSWNPQTQYLILIRNILKEDLKFIFDVLLKFHIINVVVMSESNSLLYSYDPFDKYACGHRYERIIEYGKCSELRHKKLYPYKLVTGLRNCTLRVKCVHWPPYSINPTKNNNSVYSLGVEQYILNLLSVLEHFHINFIYSFVDGEMFTVFDKNMSAIGPLKSLQNGSSDVIIGGMLLTHPRIEVFDYIDEHLSSAEDIRYVVKKATAVSSWKNLYLEFSTIVWITLLFSLIFYFLFFIIVIRPRDIGEVFLKILASMFLVSYRIKGSCFTKYLFIAWVWFAYLVNSYYQSSLVSLVTNPCMNYQISDEMDIIKYNLKPCISILMRDFMLSVDSSSTFEKNENKDCDRLLQSISTVGQYDDIYTVTLNTIYTYHERSFYNEKGNPTIYTFNRPLNKINLAIYVYKGFPLLEKLRIHTLRLSENGLIENYLRLLYRKNNVRYNFNENVKKAALCHLTEVNKVIACDII